jgi:hypothetical protein
MLKTSALISLSITIAGAAHAASNMVDISQTSNQICVTSNGTPNHAIGKFPNAGNPNRFKRQNINVCVPLNPVKSKAPNFRVRSIGIAKNGIIIRPGTADWYDASSPRKHSRDRTSGWNLDGMGARRALGLDSQNAHVDNRGLYHYHGMPPALVGSKTHLGWAADGFEIHYVGSSAQSSWQLKQGTRPTAPNGAFDGTYNQDYEFIARSGNLDTCNGGMLNGKYVYFATDTYPYFPHCLYGKVSRDF